ncbi:MAG: hypothetical protein KAX24_04880 [Anaerolineae bacterium]|nr:hypothetical protein [Anaerolineae bacterium]
MGRVARCFHRHCPDADAGANRHADPDPNGHAEALAGHGRPVYGHPAYSGTVAAAAETDEAVIASYNTTTVRLLVWPGVFGRVSSPPASTTNQIHSWLLLDKT